MSTSQEFGPAPERWVTMPFADRDAERFTDLVAGEKHHAFSALGILHAAQTHFNQHSAAQQVTLVRGYPETAWSLPTKQLVVALSMIGHNLRNGSVDKIAQSDGYVLFEGQLPSPAVILAAPGLSYLVDRLNESTKRGRPSVFNYAELNRAGVANDRIALGFANPLIGARTLLDMQLGPLKTLYGFPPPRLKPLRVGGTL